MRFFVNEPATGRGLNPAAPARRHALHLFVPALAALTLLLALLPAQPASARETEWVLTQTLINPDKVTLEYHGGGNNPIYFGEERFKDKREIYGVSATGFQIEDHDQDRDYIAWDLDITFSFDAPETALEPGKPYELTASFSYSGMIDWPYPYKVFAYYSQDLNFDPNEPLVFSPSSQDPGDSFKTWTFTVPHAEPGAAIQIQASLERAPGCKVIWKYEARAAASGAAKSTGEGVLGADCTINEAVFERDWKKYSDIDERIELKSRSWEAQKADEITRKIGELEDESIRLQAEIILNGQVRREARELKKALVTTLRANLVKSLFRLSILTADAMKTGYDLGTTYAKLFTLEAVETLPDALEKIQDVTAVVGGLMPEGSEAVNAVNENAGEMKTALDLLTASGDEAAIILMGEALNRAEEKAKEYLPPWDTVQLSPEDINILESQFLHNQALNEFLEESYAEDRLRSARVRTEIPGEIERLREELAEWEGKEKQRVREMLIAGCQDSKQ